MVVGCGTAPGPTVSPSLATPSAPTAAAACGSTDLDVTGGQPSGGAGRRGAEVTLVNRSGRACTLPAHPTVAIADAGGNRLLESATDSPATGTQLLKPGTSVSFVVEYSNWCDESVRLPLYFLLLLDGEAAQIADLSAATRDDLPPCNGPGQSATVSTTEWQLGG